MTTPGVPEVIRVIERFRRALLALDSATAAALVQAYGPVFVRARREIDALLAEMSGKQLSMEEVLRLQRLESLERQITVEVTRYARVANGRITQAQREAVGLSQQAARRTVDAALPPGIDTRLLARAGITWNTLPAAAFESLVGSTGAGSPLWRLLAPLGDQVRTGVIGALREGIALGRNPRDTALAVQKQFGLGLTRSLAIARTECLPGDTLVDGAVIEAIYRRWYEGPMVEIVTKAGRKLSATPNHPMLTRRGWVAAGQIAPGDNLICDSRKQQLCSPGNKDVERGPSTLREIFDTLSAIGIRERRRGRKPDFHGDGREGDVDVLHALRPLSIGRFAPVYKPVVDHFLSPAYESSAPFCHRCKRLLSVDEQPCLCVGANRGIRLVEPVSHRAVVDTVRASDGHLRFARTITPGNLLQVNSLVEAPVAASVGAGLILILGTGTCAPSGPDHFANGPTVSVKERGNLPRGEPGLVEFDDVILVRLRAWSGHVYNLSTPYGYFATSQVYTGNTLRSYREATRQQYQANRGVVKGYQRHSARDSRVCMACIVLDGTFYELDQPLDEHPNGRCALVPVTATYQDLGLNVEQPPETRVQGREWFLAQDEATQRQMLGDGRYEAWREGKFELDRLVKVEHNRVWGDAAVERPLKELV